MNISYIKGKVINFNPHKSTYLLLFNNLGIWINILSNKNIILNHEYEFYIFTHFLNAQNIEIKYFAFDLESEQENFQKLISIKGIGIKYAIEIFQIYLNHDLNEKNLIKYLKINKNIPNKILKIFNLTLINL